MDQKYECFNKTIKLFEENIRINLCIFGSNKIFKIWHLNCKQQRENTIQIKPPKLKAFVLHKNGSLSKDFIRLLLLISPLSYRDNHSPLFFPLFFFLIICFLYFSFTIYIYILKLYKWSPLYMFFCDFLFSQYYVCEHHPS